MAAYYNENDAYAAQWLRNLIAEGLIADGEVDVRSIVDVRPAELAGFAQCHFFAGIGGWSRALRLAGWDDARPVWTGSCPCQPFSLAGKQKGFADERHLWPFWRELIRARLQSSLESRLRALLTGSDLCEVTWKPWATPWGHSLFKPRARVRTTFGTATGLWQTMVADDAMNRENGKVNSRGEPKLSAQAVSAWPTPTTRDHKDGPYCPNVPVNGLLGRMVWPTPTACADKSIRTPDGARKEVARGRSPDLAAHVMATWGTPRVTGNGGHGNADRAADGRARLEDQAQIVNGLPVLTAKRGALNPDFVCWLMGYPTAWLNCAPSATPSSRRSRPRSSAP